MHRLKITRAYFQVGSLVASCDIKFTTASSVLNWSGFVNQATGPTIVEVPDDGTLIVEHSPLCSVSFHYVDENNMRITFQEVAVNPSKTGKCPGCHKVAKRTTKFFQTLSPFNTNPDGSRKTSRQILDELAPQVVAWKLEPTYHAKCEG